MDVVKEIDYHATCLSIHCPAYLTHSLTKYNLFAQSICTHNSCFKNMGGFVCDPEKNGLKYGFQTAGWKKTGSSLLKNRRGSLDTSLFEQQSTCFFVPCFSQPIFWTYFYVR